MTYTSTGRVQTITDANNHTTSYQYDSEDRVTTIQFPDGTTNIDTYNTQGNVTRSQMERGNATTYSFDGMKPENRFHQCRLGNQTTITYDADGNKTEVQAPTPAGQTASRQHTLMIKWIVSRP